MSIFGTQSRVGGRKLSKDHYEQARKLGEDVGGSIARRHRSKKQSAARAVSQDLDDQQWHTPMTVISTKDFKSGRMSLSGGGSPVHPSSIVRECHDVRTAMPSSGGQNTARWEQDFRKRLQSAMLV